MNGIPIGIGLIFLGLCINSGLTKLARAIRFHRDGSPFHGD